MKSRLLYFIVSLAVTGSAAENSPFYFPVRNNDLAALRQLIVNPGPKARDSRGNSGLMYAAALGSAEGMRLLLDAGADPNAANELGATPLMWCAGDLAKVRLLLAKGAKVSARSKLGRTPLEIAAAYDGAIEAARLLMDNGADVNAVDEGGGTVLEQAAASNNIEVVRLLLAKGAKVNVVDKGGFTALLAAASNGDRCAPLVKLLIEHGAAVNVKSGDTFEVVKNGPIALGHLTPLQEAAGLASYEAVAALINAGADVNAKDVRGATPLVFAIATDRPNPKIVELLLAKGAAREPAMEWVRKYQNPAILPLFGLKASTVATGVAGGASGRSARDGVTMALGSSQPASAKFLATGGCVSCHAQHLNGMAVAAARKAGLKPDAKLEAEDTKATVSLRGAIQEELFQVQDPPAAVDAMQFSLLQLAGAGVAPTLAMDSLLHHIAAMQRKEGDWPNYAEQRPPIEDGGFNHTAMGIRTLRLYAIRARKAEFDERVARAAAWLDKNQPITTEDRSTQILGLVWAGQAVAPKRIQELVAKQRADGGWGQTDSLRTDAYATGEVLWALHESGMKSSDPVYRRGVDYLLRTQAKDGTWHVVTRALAFQPYFESSFPYGHDQWISQAGTAMATMALTFSVN